MNISVVDGSGDILEFLLPVVILVECRVSHGIHIDMLRDSRG